MFNEQHLVSRLFRAGSALGEELTKGATLSLQAYLEQLVPTAKAPQSLSLFLLVEALARHLHNLGELGVDDWCETLSRTPMIQQADHSCLVLDHETLLNNVLFAAAAHLAGVRQILTVQCSGVSCITQRGPFRGPPFVNTRNATFNIFGRSIRNYASAAFCCLEGPAKSIFAPINGEARTLSSDTLIADLLNREWPDPLEGMRRMNRMLWCSMGGAALADILFVDDRFSNELLALHLEREESPIHRLFFEPRARTLFLMAKRELVARPSNFAVNRAEPDFFWFRRKQRLLPVIMHPVNRVPVYLDGDAERPLDIPMTPRCVAEAVRMGRLIPDRILIYFARCLLPGVRAIGGTSQQDYVKLYRELLVYCHQEFALLDATELANVNSLNLSRLGGAPLLEVTQQMTETIAHVGRDTNWGDILAPYMLMPIEETIGELRCASYLERKLVRK